MTYSSLPWCLLLVLAVGTAAIPAPPSNHLPTHGWWDLENDPSQHYPRDLEHRSAACPGYPGPAFSGAQHPDAPVLASIKADSVNISAPNAIATGVPDSANSTANRSDLTRSGTAPAIFCWDIFDGGPYGVRYSDAPFFLLPTGHRYRLTFNYVQQSIPGRGTTIVDLVFYIGPYIGLRLGHGVELHRKRVSSTHGVYDFDVPSGQQHQVLATAVFESALPGPRYMSGRVNVFRLS